MRLWLRARSVPVLLAIAAASLLFLLLPGSAIRATPSPGGATLMAAAFVSLALPVALGWACDRGSSALDAVALRPIILLDLALACASTALVSAVAHALSLAGLAQAGDVAARNVLLYLGLLIGGASFLGWRQAALLPVIYVVAVAILGRGPDVDHPAWWAWAAAGSSDPGSWGAAWLVLASGFIAQGVRLRRWSR